MNNHLVPVLLLLVLPALYLGHRLGWTEKTWVRWLGGAVLATAVAWSLPWTGLDFIYVKYVNLLIAAATAFVLLSRHRRLPWALERSRRLTVLAALAALAVVNYLNFFAFHGHGQRAFVHLHDVAHYYLGAKYYAELGYTDLYTAMLRAEAESYNNRFKAIEARDLKTYERVHIRSLLERSDPVKAAFSSERWADFQLDVAHFRERLGQEHYGQVLLDHGFNPTPVWALLGGTLARFVPAGSEEGILLLCLIDPLLLLAAFAALAWAFGREAMLLAVIYYSIAFGATFGWTGGAFLRSLWFFALIVGLACLHKQRFPHAGALLALATMLRVFPAFFVVPLVMKAVAIWWRRRALPRRYRLFFAAFAVTASLLFALTGALPRSFEHWAEFRANMENHVANISPNTLGLTDALFARRSDEQITADEFEALKNRRAKIYQIQLVLGLLPMLLLTARIAARRRDLEAVALALPLLYCGLTLAAYYYVFLVVLILIHRASAEHLALVFTVETASYVLLLFEDRDARLFVYRGLLLVFLYLALELRFRRPRYFATLKRKLQ